MKPTQHGRDFENDIFKCILLYFVPILLKCVPKGQINNNPALVQIKANMATRGIRVALRRTGDRPLSEPVMA